MNPKSFALLLITSVLFMSFPWEAYALDQSFKDEICKDASDEAKASIKRSAPKKEPTSVESRQYYQHSDYYRVQAEQLCREASPKVQKLNIEGVSSVAVGILASLTQKYGDANRFADECRSFLEASPETCEEQDIDEFVHMCEAFLDERIRQCKEQDVDEFANECAIFMDDRRSYCAQKETDAKIIDQFALECKVFFDRTFPAECADVEEETNLIDQFSEQCKEFIDDGRDFCLGILEDAKGVVVDIEKKVADIGIDAAWKIPYAVLREVALIAVKVADRLAWRRIEAEAEKRQRKIAKVHDDLVELCMPDTLIQKGRSGSIQSTVTGMFGKMLSACIGSFF